MYARVNYRQIDADKMNESLRIFRDSTMPEMKTRKGFAGGLVLTDLISHKLIAMILWDIGHDMSAPVHPGYVNAIAVEPPVREEYEVSVEV
ncbi:MAG: hypothetical protein O2909_06895 [Chloroflexi bacterium]|nr:hypothetical protein [Chloroflexota bacterium]MDA1219150.1 hypothetical protein [Chloroflexota bacterium]PKB57157.1 MAG: hypothetical protein BZY73_04685 [SAR202 cluster bacterium Casp-Chloro-G3]